MPDRPESYPRGRSAAAPRKFAPVLVVVLVVALEPGHDTVVLESEDVRGHAVEEQRSWLITMAPAGEGGEALLERAQRGDVQVVAGFVQ